MFKVGDTVAIPMKDYASNRFKLEGIAVIVATTDKPDHYLVCFAGDDVAVSRCIDRAVREVGGAEVYIAMVNRALAAMGIGPRKVTDA